MRIILLLFLLPFFIRAEIIAEGDFYHYQGVDPYRLDGFVCPSPGNVFKDGQSLANSFASGCYVKNDWVDSPDTRFSIVDATFIQSKVRLKIIYTDSYERTLYIYPDFLIKPCPQGQVLDTEQNACVNAVCESYNDCFNKFHSSSCSSGQFVSSYSFSSISNFSFNCSSDYTQFITSAHTDFFCGTNNTDAGRAIGFSTVDNGQKTHS